MTMIYHNTARVIVIRDKFYGDRYYSYFKKNLVTAWCLAGATLFQTNNSVKLDAVIKKLQERKIKFEVKNVTIINY